MLHCITPPELQYKVHVYRLQYAVYTSSTVLSTAVVYRNRPPAPSRANMNIACTHRICRMYQLKPYSCIQYDAFMV